MIGFLSTIEPSYISLAYKEMTKAFKLAIQHENDISLQLFIVA